jgi:hypothetical protein
LDRSGLAAAAKLIQEESMQGLSPLVRALFIAWPLTVVVSISGCSSGEAPPPGDGMPACTLGSTMEEIESTLFKGDKCKTCHTLTASGAHPLYPTDLDLGSPGLAARMVDQPSEANPNRGKCSGRVLVPKADPLGGLFVQKVEMAPCGDRMPQALPPLTANEVSCVKRWAVLAAKSIP